MMIKDSTKRKIDKAVAKTLKEAGMKEHPLLIENLLSHLELDREFYDLEDPSLLRRFWHKVKVRGRILSKIKKISNWPHYGCPIQAESESLLVKPYQNQKRNGHPFTIRRIASLNGTGLSFLEILHKH